MKDNEQSTMLLYDCKKDISETLGNIDGYKGYYILMKKKFLNFC